MVVCSYVVRASLAIMNECYECFMMLTIWLAEATVLQVFQDYIGNIRVYWNTLATGVIKVLLFSKIVEKWRFKGGCRNKNLFNIQMVPDLDYLHSLRSKFFLFAFVILRAKSWKV